MLVYNLEQLAANHLLPIATGLIVTFLAFQTADIFYRYTIHFTGFEIVVEFFIDAVKTVAGAVIVVEGYL